MRNLDGSFAITQTRRDAGDSIRPNAQRRPSVNRAAAAPSKRYYSVFERVTKYQFAEGLRSGSMPPGRERSNPEFSKLQ
ncbi:MAG TPA: hypothetical protein VK834_02425, partial [Bradyrhizobium sp.]|nr:hypothetical protein [Bradyrhizobium sp.]